MVDVFISYKREEGEAVTTIAERLRALRLEVWLDSALRQTGEFDEEIAAKLKEAKCVLVCWTPAAIDSKWVRSEAAIAQESTRLVACFLEPTELIPPFVVQQTEDLMRWGGQEDDPAWIRLLTGIGEKVGRPGIAAYASVMAVAAPLDAMRTWAAAHGDDPLADGVWDRIRLIEGENSADRIERERLEARSRDQRRKANDARSRALAKERGLRDPVAQRRRMRMLTAGFAVLLIGVVCAGYYLNDAQSRSAELGRVTTPREVRAFMAANAWHPIATEALRKYRQLDATSWSAARATGTLDALRAYRAEFADAPEGEFLTDEKALEADAERVQRAQIALARLQIYRGPPHGGLDTATREAIETFRFRSGAPVSGTVDDDLLAAIARVIDSLPTIPPSMLVVRRPGPPSEDDYRVLAARSGLDAATIYAVRAVESGQVPGFSADGRPTMTFERSLFRRVTNGAYDASHPQVSGRDLKLVRPGDERWAQLDEAYALDPSAAYQAACIGVFQICGNHYRDVGFESPGEMAWFLSQSETNQVEVFIRFIEKSGMLPLPKQKDWVAFARRYNGSLSSSYAERVSRAYDEGLRSLGFFVR